MYTVFYTFLFLCSVTIKAQAKINRKVSECQEFIR